MSDLERLIEAIVDRRIEERLGARRTAAPDYLSVAEAAAHARVTPGTIRRWVRAGELTRHEAGSRVRVRRDELERLLACDVVPIEKNLSIAELARRRFG